MKMHPVLSAFLRVASGVVVLALGAGLMRVLIGMKEEAPTSMPPVAQRLVRTVEARSGAVVAEVPVEGRVEAVDRMDVLAEVGGVLLSGGKEFREGVSFRKGEVLLRLDDAEARAALTRSPGDLPISAWTSRSGQPCGRGGRAPSVPNAPCRPCLKRQVTASGSFGRTAGC
jgi:hypothetical protein